jgi:DNA-binding NarL/FixJ family response regulator
MRVVIAEDSVLLREGLVRVMRDADIEVAAAVGDAQALLAAVGATRPDLAIVDIRMPPTHTDEGLVAAETLLSADLPTPVLVLSQSVEPAHAVRLLGDGRRGVGYLLKDRVTDIDELIGAVRQVAGGGNVIDPAVVAVLIGRRQARDALVGLTDREGDVLAFMAEGRSNRAIAAGLGVGEKTVETHVARIFSKLGLEPSLDDHRRVLAVLTWLRGR